MNEYDTQLVLHGIAPGTTYVGLRRVTTRALLMHCGGISGGTALEIEEMNAMGLCIVRKSEHKRS